MDDPHELERFVEAQDPIYSRAKAELARGEKVSHWMWFVFPQLKSLGHSPTAHRYGIASREEASAYWNHPVLGPRLAECTSTVLAVEGRTALQIFGSPDHLKFCSSMTLFDQIAPEEPVFRWAIEKYCDGVQDPKTIALL